MTLQLTDLIKLGLSSCKDDKDEPSGSTLDKIQGIQTLIGLWRTNDGSSDFIIVTNKNNPPNIDLNRMVMFWDGTLTNMGVPVFANEKNEYYYTWGSAGPRLEIPYFDDKKGIIKIYNSAARETKTFYNKGVREIATITNDSYTAIYRNVEVKVYAVSDPATPIYTASIGEITQRSRSNTFWTGGVKANVEATLTDDKGKVSTALWKDLEPNTSYTLSL